MITYNQEDYIEAALDGIRFQTRVPDEVIIGDDGSQDATQLLIRNYVTRHGLEGRWTLLLSPHNRGINANLQAVISHATADILLPMAGDDISLPERCAVVEAAFAHYPKAAILLTSAEVIDQYGEKKGELPVVPGFVTDVHKAIRRGNAMVNAIGQNWRREIFDRFGPLPTDVPNEDTNISFRGFLLGGIVCVPDKTVRYRVHSESTSAWLHTSISDTDYLKRIILDMDVRARHMAHWVGLLEESEIPNREAYSAQAKRKSDFYKWLGSMQTHNIAMRLKGVFLYIDLLSWRDGFYAFFGPAGVLIWRRVRIWSGRHRP
ncbi:MAG: glycosyltransferase [Candidatus Obscuribacterales bacterium]|nr:glycosyltransferase [Candidatus Obscuribacterales bacterium]